MSELKRGYLENEVRLTFKSAPEKYLAMQKSDAISQTSKEEVDQVQLSATEVALDDDIKSLGEVADIILYSIDDPVLRSYYVNVYAWKKSSYNHERVGGDKKHQSSDIGGDAEMYAGQLSDIILINEQQRNNS